MTANLRSRLRDIIFKQNKRHVPHSENKSTNQQEATFRFSGIGPNGVLYQSIPNNNAGAAAEFGTSVMLREPNHDHIFNDYPTYKFLCDASECISVKIAAVRAFFMGSSSCHGIQVLYESTFRGGRTQLTEGAQNVNRIGFYSPFMPDWIYLEDDEYITGLRVSQEDVISGIVFVTNRREIRYDGRSATNGRGVETLRTSMMRSDSAVEIIALAGTTTVALQRIAYYAKKPTLLASEDSYSGSFSCDGPRGGERNRSGDDSSLSFYFSGTRGLGATCVTAAQNQAREIGDNIMRCESNCDSTFNDFALYEELCLQPRCKRVEISSIRVYHHKHLYIQDFDVTYRSSFADGRTTYMTGNRRDGFTQRFFAVRRPPRKTQFSSIDLADGEYITGLDLVQGELISSMTFHTNYRRFHFGAAVYEGGTLIRIPTHQNSMRIVALAGTYCREGALHRVGYYSEITGAWAIAGPFITLRCLWHQGRAKPVSSSKNIMEEEQAAAILRAMDLPDGVFAHLLSYII